MNLMDLLQNAGGDRSIDKLADSVGIGQSDARSMIEALAPALSKGLQKQATSSGGLEALGRALSSGHHQKYIDEPEKMASSATRTDGNKILGHLFGSKDVSRNVAAHASQQTGIQADLVKKALPLVAGMAMGALSKKTNAGQEMGGGSGLGDLVGGLLGGGGRDDDFGVDDLLGMAKKLF